MNTSFRVRVRAMCDLVLMGALFSLFNPLAPRLATAAGIYTISVANATIVANGAIDVDVTVAGSGEAVNLVGYEFRILPVAGTSSQLQFVEEAEDFLGEDAYLFLGNSLAANDGVPSSVGTVSTSALPNDTFVGGDATDNFADVALSGTKILVRLRLKHLAGPADPPTTIGHQFLIGLVPENGDSLGFANGASNTGFLGGSLAGVAFASQSGVVTVGVPEPGALALAIGIAWPLVRRRSGFPRLRERVRLTCQW